MYKDYRKQPYPYNSMYNSNYNYMYGNYNSYPCSYYNSSLGNYTYDPKHYSNNMVFYSNNEITDYGPEPFVINIEDATMQNNTFRSALWTGDHLQLTLMSINVGEDIGLEIHQDLDQFIRIEDGEGTVMMGDSEDNLNFVENVSADYIFIIPAGKWHNLINTGDRPIKLYSIYAPPQHPHGTVHATKSDAMEAE